MCGFSSIAWNKSDFSSLVSFWVPDRGRVSWLRPHIRSRWSSNCSPDRANWNVWISLLDLCIGPSNSSQLNQSNTFMRSELVAFRALRGIWHSCWRVKLLCSSTSCCAVVFWFRGVFEGKMQGTDSRKYHVGCQRVYYRFAWFVCVTFMADGVGIFKLLERYCCPHSWN